MRIFLLCMICVGVLNCSDIDNNTKELKQGIYAWKKQSKLALALNQLIYGQTTSLGDTLTLIDSVNFHTISCGNFGYGKYEIEGDSLHLNYDSTGKRYDSSMYYGKYTDVYHIVDSKTVTHELRVKYSLESEDSFKVKTRLYYVEEQ